MHPKMWCFVLEGVISRYLFCELDYQLSSGQMHLQTLVRWAEWKLVFTFNGSAFLTPCIYIVLFVLDCSDKMSRPTLPHLRFPSPKPAVFPLYFPYLPVFTLPAPSQYVFFLAHFYSASLQMETDDLVGGESIWARFTEETNYLVYENVQCNFCMRAY